MVCVVADLICVDNFGSTAWDYANVKRMHYCLLIIASYIRQNSRNQGNGTDGSFVKDGSDLGFKNLTVTLLVFAARGKIYFVLSSALLLCVNVTT